jgi:hypothetical protein
MVTIGNPHDMLCVKILVDVEILFGTDPDRNRVTW